MILLVMDLINYLLKFKDLQQEITKQLLEKWRWQFFLIFKIKMKEIFQKTLYFKVNIVILIFISMIIVKYLKDILILRLINI